MTLTYVSQADVDRENANARRRTYRQPKTRLRRWVVNRQDWRDDAACRTVPPADRDRIFFPTDGSKSRAASIYDEARTYCRNCPVVGDCLASEMIVVGAARHDGFRGNLTPAERNRLGDIRPEFGQTL